MMRFISAYFLACLFLHSASGLCMSEETRTGIIIETKRRVLHSWSAVVATCVEDHLKSVEPITEGNVMCFRSESLQMGMKDALVKCVSEAPRWMSKREVRQLKAKVRMVNRQEDGVDGPAESGNKEGKQHENAKQFGQEKKKEVLGFIASCSSCYSGCHICCYNRSLGGASGCNCRTDIPCNRR